MQINVLGLVGCAIIVGTVVAEGILLLWGKPKGNQSKKWVIAATVSNIAGAALMIPH